MQLLRGVRSKSEIKVPFTQNTKISAKVVACLSTVVAAGAVAFKSKVIKTNTDLLQTACQNMKHLTRRWDLHWLDPSFFLPRAYAKNNVVLPIPLSDPPIITAQKFLKHAIPLPVQEKPFTDLLENLNHKSQFLNALQEIGTDLPQLLEQVQNEGTVERILASLPEQSSNNKDFILQVIADESSIFQKNGFISKKVFYPYNDASKKDSLNSSSSTASESSQMSDSIENSNSTTDIWHSMSPYSLFEILSNRIIQVIRHSPF